MDDPSDPTASRWSGSRSVKSRNVVQRAVTALLDELAPERVLTRVEKLRGPVEQHRTPTGCVLQAARAAVSVSWFAPSGSETTPGELHVVVWRGTVSRRGVPQRRDGATIVTEMVLLPVETKEGGVVWRAADETEYDTPSLAARCLALLEGQMAS